MSSDGEFTAELIFSRTCSARYLFSALESARTFPAWEKRARPVRWLK